MAWLATTLSLPEARRVLVTLGGSDVETRRRLSQTHFKSFRSSRFEIASGAGHWRCPDACGCGTREGTRYLRDVRSMAEHGVAWADLAISRLRQWQHKHGSWGLQRDCRAFF